jgi:hypothetical protein
MNERIKRILEQADISMSMTEFSGCLKGQNYLVTDSNLSEMQLEKFAELIVLECANYITHKATIETLLGERLKEHFGVKS